MRCLSVIISALIFTFFVSGQTDKLPKLKRGSWTGNLQLSGTDKLPFQFVVKGRGEKMTMSVINSQEVIELERPVLVNDSILLTFPAFNSKLVLHQRGKRKLHGYWLNLNKNSNYTIPLEICFGYKTRFPVGRTATTFPYLDGRWETTFEPGTKSEYKGVGLFDQQENRVEGTFMTETGDFRFMEGNVTVDSLFLSAFDGSHAFLMKSRIVGDSMYGVFLSGKHWKGTWNARCNESFDLPHPDSLTYIVDNKPVEFTLNDLDGNTFTFPNSTFENKVTIIQIMGTWCPNCMDETRYFNELYSKYHTQGLEIISVGYEVGSSFEEHAARIRKLKERYDLSFHFIVGGAANKGLASEHFRMLNQIISFPTAIFIGRDGNVKKVHTGFNGPGTGKYYEDYIRETDLFIQELLNVK